MADIDIDYFYLEDKDVIICKIKYYDFDLDQEISATGSSKRDPVDKFDIEVGRNLAVGRAFEKLSKKLIRRANGKTRHNDEVRKAKENHPSKVFSNIMSDLEAVDVTNAKEIKPKRKLRRSSKNR
jgi:hypothetical protein